MNPEDLPDGWAIAGYDGVDRWYDVENGDVLPDFSDLWFADQVVLSYTDADNETHYWTVHGGFDDDFTIEDAIEDLEGEYGEAS